ncbi:hypothetical protein BKA69DRAFT_1104275 [Paraphysoderma sedebokerense]|nr:hypothetical protein BKA69DRAFT_1104275 [Paraphysoderma sedebokerense]
MMKFSLSIFLVFSLYSLAQTYDEDSATQLSNVPGYGVFEGVTPSNPFTQVVAPESGTDNPPQIYAEKALSQYGAYIINK